MQSALQPLPSASTQKVVSFEAAPELFASLRQAGKTLVQSHGIWDLMHPGHICHLEEAAALGDVLVVTLTSDKFVNKGPGRPYFNEQLRLRSLAALACVHYVVPVPFPDAVPAIECVRPHIYCRGKEYEDPDWDRSGSIQAETRAVERLGGRVHYVGSVKYSSTKLLNQYFDHLSAPVRSFCNALAAQYTRRDFHDAVESFRDLKVLVVGETIFDRYSYLKVQGLTSKNKIISGRFLDQETQCGGALAVFRHVKQFTDRVRYVSLLGTEPWVNELVAPELTQEQDGTIRDQRVKTIVKERFVEPLVLGKEMSKLFAVNFLDPGPPPPEVLEKVKNQLRKEIREADAVLLLDFGHGLMQPELRQLLQDSAPFLALNCQTNSNNHGYNIISRQYQRADAFTLDEQELMLACGRRDINFQSELQSMSKQFNSRYAWLTRGAVETTGITDGQAPCLCPPLEYDVVDTIGAGDAFFSVAALAAVRKLPISLATFLGQLAGAQAVKIVGNSRSISKATLVQGGMSLLNF
jgi:cytidyltransferase-like protein